MLSQALRLIRIYHNLKQKEVAKMLGVSTSYISELERAKRIPNIEMIEAYGKAFHMSPSSILFFSENLINPHDVSSKIHKFMASKALSFLDNLAKVANLEKEETEKLPFEE